MEIVSGDRRHLTSKLLVGWICTAGAKIVVLAKTFGVDRKTNTSAPFDPGEGVVASCAQIKRLTRSI